MKEGRKQGREKGVKAKGGKEEGRRAKGRVGEKGEGGKEEGKNGGREGVRETG